MLPGAPGWPGPTPMPDAKPLAIIHGYDDLVAAIRARVAELGVTQATIDDVAGLQSGYAGKLLGPRRIKKLGIVSLGCVLGSLGMKLVAFEDPEALARVRSRLVPRKDKAHKPRPRPAQSP
jgi:hypothetical protein